MSRLTGPMADALRAIKELHRRDPDGGMGYKDGGGYGTIDLACLICGTSDEYAVPWPCNTWTLADQALIKARAALR